jgi:hypothetical protein
MQQSALDIYNAALSAVHAKGRLSSLTDNKKERIECDVWYDIVLRTVQESAFWSCCKVSATLLGRYETRVSHFAYSYELPANCLRPRYLMTYYPFELAYDENYNVVRLFTDDPNAQLVYTQLQETVTLWTPGHIMATIYGLAGHISGPLTGRGELIQKNFRLANDLLVEAQAASINSEQLNIDFVPDTIKARGYSGPDQRANFYYPFGGLFGVPNA